MKKTLAAFAVLGALALAPAAMAGDPQTAPVAAEPSTFQAPAPVTASSEQLAETHVIVDEAGKAQTAGGGYAAPLIYVVVVVAIIIAVV